VVPSRAGLLCWTILLRLQQDEFFADASTLVYTAAWGSRSDTGENRQVPREKSTQAKEA
jgi:hypothetical protein